MVIEELKLFHFRNYEEETVVFHPKVNIVAGRNAQGKTNLLEALSILSMGRSFRTRKDKELIGFGYGFCRIACLFSKGEKQRSISMEIGNDGKKAMVDGIPIEKNIDLLENLYLVVFSPEDLKIVKEDPDKRRKFMDRELCQLKPVYYRNLARYKKILLQRNTLLRVPGCRSDQIEPWDFLLSEAGSKVILERKEFLEKLNRISGELHRSITGGKEELILTYDSDLPVCGSFEEQEQAMIKALGENREKDILRGTTGRGPHRDDIQILVNDVDVRHFGSQGQQRTAALSMKLAELALIKQETGEDAVLLLDDVLSELDGERQEYLTKSLKDTQLFITTAELNKELLEKFPEHRIYFVEKGCVTSK